MSSLTLVLDKCVSCNICVEECVFLYNLGKNPREIAEGLLKGDERVRGCQFLCFLCGLCRAVCPNQVEVVEMMLDSRHSLAESLVQQNTCYRIYFPDEPVFFVDALKERMNINFSGYVPRTFRYAFLPGCSMSCFSPKAVTKLYELLAEELGDVGVLDVCCGKPLYDSGLESRARKWLDNRLVVELKKRGCKTIITACPNCFYYLKSKLPSFYEVTTPYEVLKDYFERKPEGMTLTIHDSCPDRFEGVFAEQVRKTLSECRIIEMAHSKRKTLCCGAGGLVSCSDMALPLTLVERRLSEFAGTGASLMVVYCYTCASTFWSLQQSVEVKHLLNLLLNVEDNSEVVKRGEIGKMVMEIIVGGR
ncbi:MAG: (Fe-S)-binding protein [Candidatus Verstraetearchaeota archaeon]|nr:(Fe-S)-binding protein [Candidatus Verstraetearchaeota archaeon]